LKVIGESCLILSIWFCFSEALNAARDGDENVVAIAILIAKHHKILNTMNTSRQTLLHLTAENENCSAKLSRLIITRGADGAIPDVWGLKYSFSSFSIGFQSFHSTLSMEMSIV
jgi:hypothetical protein